MAITRKQAITLNTFHYAYVSELGVCNVWRRNGKTQTWKTRPTHFRVPVKHGLYEYFQITQDDAHMFYAPEDCPACHGTKL